MAVRRKKRYSRESEGKAAVMSYAMIPEKMVLVSAYVSAWASMSMMLSAICRCLIQDWWLETWLLATCDAGMSSSADMVLLSVLDSEIGRVSFGRRL